MGDEVRSRFISPDSHFNSFQFAASRITGKSYGPRVPDRTMVAKWTTVLLVGFGTDRLRREETMKTAGRENPTHGATVPRNRAHGAVRTDKSRSIKRAAKQEKVQPKEMCFFLTSTFIELTGQVELLPSCRSSGRDNQRSGQRRPISCYWTPLTD